MLNEKPVRYAFDCAKCFKTLQLEERVYRKAYEGHDTCLSCRTTEKPASVSQRITKEVIGLVEYDVEEGNPVYWGHAQELLLEINRLNERNAKLVHENDELMAENAKLIVLLNRTLPYIEPEIEQQGYGFFPGGDPTKFIPDSDNTEKEMENWKKACDLWNESKVEAASSHVNLVNDKGDYIGHATIANLGMGIYNYEDEEAKDIFNQIKSLEELK